MIYTIQPRIPEKIKIVHTFHIKKKLAPCILIRGVQAPMIDEVFSGEATFKL